MTAKAAVAQRGIGVPGPRPHLLVVDDDPDVAALLAAWLVDLGDVYTATTSAQALALATVVPLDLAVVDIVLPRMDGFDLAQNLRLLPGLAGMPVVFVTGSDRLDVLVRSEELGAAKVLYKPLRQEELQQVIVGLLGPPAAPAF